MKKFIFQKQISYSSSDSESATSSDDEKPDRNTPPFIKIADQLKNLERNSAKTTNDGKQNSEDSTKKKESYLAKRTRELLAAFSSSDDEKPIIAQNQDGKQKKMGNRNQYELSKKISTTTKNTNKTFLSDYESEEEISTKRKAKEKANKKNFYFDNTKKADTKSEFKNINKNKNKHHFLDGSESEEETTIIIKEADKGKTKENPTFLNDDEIDDIYFHKTMKTKLNHKTNKSTQNLSIAFLSESDTNSAFESEESKNDDNDEPPLLSVAEAETGQQNFHSLKRPIVKMSLKCREMSQKKRQQKLIHSIGMIYDFFNQRIPVKSILCAIHDHAGFLRDAINDLNNHPTKYDNYSLQEQPKCLEKAILNGYFTFK